MYKYVLTLLLLCLLGTTSFASDDNGVSNTDAQFFAQVAYDIQNPPSFNLLADALRPDPDPGVCYKYKPCSVNLDCGTYGLCGQDGCWCDIL